VRFLWGKNIEEKGVHNMGSISLWISFAFTFFCPQKTHNATLFYRGTCIQGRRHLVKLLRLYSHAHTDLCASQ
jgi:hypothetical protein